MAKLSAHGVEVGTIYTLTGAKRWMTDGKILKNPNGQGWKLHATVKPGITPMTAYAHNAQKHSALLSDMPAFAAYRSMLHATAGLAKRWKLHAAITLMPNDADGVWAEACDSYCDPVHADLDEIVALCQLYNAMKAEAVRKAQAHATASAPAREMVLA